MRHWLGWLMAMCVAGGVQAAAPLKACLSDVALPPFAYFETAANGAVGTVRGLGVDVLQAALQKLGQVPASVTALPLRRCLKLVEAGAMDLVLNVPTAQIDPAPYYISEAYAAVHSVYFYSRRSRPAGIQISNLEDLRYLNVCGLFGYSFEGYGLKSASVDSGSKDYPSLIRKLHAGRCDVFFDKREVVAGLHLIDPELKLLLQDPQLVSAPLPEDSPLQFHFAIGRKTAGAESLHARLDQVLTDMERNGEVERMLQRYLP